MGYKKIAFFIIIGALLLTINNLAHSIYDTWQKQDLIKQAQLDLDDARAENQELRKDIALVSKPEFVESEARDKLLLAKPGEGIIVIPSTSIAATKQASSATTDTRPNYQKWFEVFF